jgi:hypothetical protein
LGQKKRLLEKKENCGEDPKTFHNRVTALLVEKFNEWLIRPQAAQRRRT